MKNLSLLLVIIFIATLFASCGSSPYKKRKGCKGTGSWSGKRNLGAVDQSKKVQQNQNTYVWVTKETQM